MSVAKVLMLAWVVSACASAGIGVDDTTPPAVGSTLAPSTETPNLGLELERWTGEVEWAVVEECARLGIVDCGQVVEDMKDGTCSVDGARRLLAAFASGQGSDQLESLHRNGDCAGFSF